jgi:hypothetical protein
VASLLMTWHSTIEAAVQIELVTVTAEAAAAIAHFPAGVLIVVLPGVPLLSVLVTVSEVVTDGVVSVGAEL